MNTKSKILLGGFVAVVVGSGAFLYLTRPPSSPSAPIAQVADQLASSAPAAAGAQTAIYRISQKDSKAEFAADEVLRGSPFTAIGTTSHIAGDIEIDFTNPAASHGGVIRINARTLKTDSSKRDGAIARFILQSEDAANEFIEFTPKTLSNMPAKLEVGTSFPFDLSGDLTIKGTTKSATFTGTAKLVSMDQLSGSATSVVKRSDYNLQIPSVPSVASVKDEVKLSVTIVANKVTE